MPGAWPANLMMTVTNGTAERRREDNLNCPPPNKKDKEAGHREQRQGRGFTIRETKSEHELPTSNRYYSKGVSPATSHPRTQIIRQELVRHWYQPMWAGDRRARLPEGGVTDVGDDTTVLVR